jgi:hypothetical protein
MRFGQKKHDATDYAQGKQPNAHEYQDLRDNVDRYDLAVSPGVLSVSRPAGFCVAPACELCSPIKGIMTVWIQAHSADGDPLIV